MLKCNKCLFVKIENSPYTGRKFNWCHKHKTYVGKSFACADFKNNNREVL